jgi:hypothetical protein
MSLPWEFCNASLSSIMLDFLHSARRPLILHGR